MSHALFDGPSRCEALECAPALRLVLSPQHENALSQGTVDGFKVESTQCGDRLCAVDNSGCFDRSVVRGTFFKTENV